MQLKCHQKTNLEQLHIRAVIENSMCQTNKECNKCNGITGVTCVHAAVHLMITGLSILTDVAWRGRLCNTQKHTGQAACTQTVHTRNTVTQLMDEGLGTSANTSGKIQQVQQRQCPTRVLFFAFRLRYLIQKAGVSSVSVAGYETTQTALLQ